MDPPCFTPVPVKVGSKSWVLLSTGRSYLGVDPKTGKEAWSVRWSTEHGANIADPIVKGSGLFISSGYNKGASVHKLGSRTPSEVWSSKVMRNHMNSCVLIGDYLYGVDGNAGRAVLKCIALATGKEQWSERSVGAGSLTAADGKLIVLSERGELMVAPASPKGFNPTARASVLSGKCWTVPVLANGKIYCRNAPGDMVCVDVSE